MSRYLLKQTKLYFAIYYHPQMKLLEGNVFTLVCNSVPQGGGVLPTHKAMGHTDPPTMRSTGRQYASYWNAYLFLYLFLQILND